MGATRVLLALAMFLVVIAAEDLPRGTDGTPPLPVEALDHVGPGSSAGAEGVSPLATELLDVLARVSVVACTVCVCVEEE